MIERWSAGLADDNMPESILVELAGFVARHPWWRARSDLVLRLLAVEGILAPSSVIDAGCGWGVTLSRLERDGFEATGADISPRALDRLDRPGRRLVELDLTRPLPARHPQFEAVLALDVIEHIDDDRGAVRALGQLAQPGGLVVVSVPALPELFSEFDAVQGHRRRYLPETLASAFEETGLRLDRTFWWGSWMIPLLRRRKPAEMSSELSATDVYRKHLRLPPWPAPALFRLAFALEQKRALAGRLTRGTSLFAIGRKPA